MGSRRAKIDERGRLSASLAAGLPEQGESAFSVSSAFVPGLARRYLGRWTVVEHLVGGQPWIERFPAEKLRGAELLDPVYEASYEFTERACVKRLLVSGRLALAEGEAPYEFRVSVCLDWEPGAAGEISARPLLGYQITSLDGQILGCKELERAGQDILLRSRFEGEELLLEEGEDRKRLRRAP